jgi:hypothetical protein
MCLHKPYLIGRDPCVLAGFHNQARLGFGTRKGDAIRVAILD